MSGPLETEEGQYLAKWYHPYYMPQNFSSERASIRLQINRAVLPMEQTGQIGIDNRFVNPVCGYGYPNLPAVRGFTADDEDRGAFEKFLQTCPAQVTVSDAEVQKYSDLLTKYNFTRGMSLIDTSGKPSGMQKLMKDCPPGGALASLSPSGRETLVARCTAMGGLYAPYTKDCCPSHKCFTCPTGSGLAFGTKDEWKAKYCSEGQVVTESEFKIDNQSVKCWKCETPATPPKPINGQPPPPTGVYKNCKPCGFWCGLGHKLKNIFKTKDYIKVIKPDTGQICDYVAPVRATGDLPYPMYAPSKYKW